MGGLHNIHIKDETYSLLWTVRLMVVEKLAKSVSKGIGREVTHDVIIYAALDLAMENLDKVVKKVCERLGLYD